MSGLKRHQSSALVLAMLVPISLTACGTAVKAPAATGTASGSSSQPIGAISDPAAGVVSTVTTAAGNAAGTVGTNVVAAAGDQVASAGSSLPAPVGPVVTGVGNTVAAAGNSLGNGALDNPVGVTVLNSTVTDTTSNDLVDASVISNTPASNAPVQANVLANGQIASADVTNNPDVPVVSPLLAGSTTTIDNATGTNVGSSVSLTSLSSPSAGAAAVGSALEQVGGTLVSQTNGIPGGNVVGAETGGLVSEVGTQVATAGGSVSAIPGLSTVTGQLSSASAPLDPLLDVSVANNQLIGSSAGGAAVTLDVDSAGQLAYADLTTPAGTPNPVDTLVSTTAGPSSPLYIVSAPFNAPETSITGPVDSGISNPSSLASSNPLTGLTSTVSGAAGGSNPLSSVTSTLSSGTSSANPVTTLTTTLTSAAGGSSPLSSVTSTVSSATGSTGTSGLTGAVSGVTSTVTKLVP
jgi:hypothetical protein